MFLGYMFFSNSVPCNLSPLNFKLNCHSKGNQKTKKKTYQQKSFLCISTPFLRDFFNKQSCRVKVKTQTQF